MKDHLVIDGNAFYEMDEECMREHKKKKEKTESPAAEREEKTQKNHRKGAS